MTLTLQSPITRQRGVTLIELLVGMTIGLLTIAVAMGALMVSRGVSGTVSDATEIQQQAAYAFRVIGGQLRQAGALRLNLAAQKPDTATVDVADPVAFEVMPLPTDGSNPTLYGRDAPAPSEYTLTVRFRDYIEPSFQSATSVSLQRDCLGQMGVDSANGINSPTSIIESQFVLFIDPLDATRRELRCRGGNGQIQPILRNVANFQVRYLQQAAAGSGTPQIQYANAAAVGQPTAPGWSQVFGVEVCLVLYGNEPIDLPNGSTYTDCNGTTTVDMSNPLATDMNGSAIGPQRARRMHMVFRNIYQLRSQGQAG